MILFDDGNGRTISDCFGRNKNYNTCKNLKNVFVFRQLLCNARTFSN